MNTPSNLSAEEDQNHRTRAVLGELRLFESRNIVQMDADGSWPLVWERARGMRVWDVEGRSYLDATAAFGVAAAGHANTRVVAAGRAQMGTLLHAMGDVHPHPLKAALARALSNVTFGRRSQTFDASEAATHGKTLFCNSGFEAVEAALKTAFLATKRPGVIAFEGAYHGVGYGTLNTTHRAHFRDAFLPQLREFGRFLPFPTTPQAADACLIEIRRLVNLGDVGAILFEPIQARGGVRVPAPGFIAGLRRIASDRDAVLIADEIYTGFCRTGHWFGCDHEQVQPDIYCLGKALTGGFPLSACVGRADLMDRAWPESNGEAIHTSTYLGHPVGCAMALAQLEQLNTLGCAERSEAMGAVARRLFEALIDENIGVRGVRGRGLMLGLELAPIAGRLEPPGVVLMKALLGEGWIALPEGADADVLAFTPPLIISERQVRGFVQAVRAILRRLSKPSAGRSSGL